VQTLKLYTPKEPDVEHDQIDALRNLIKAQDNKEEAVDQNVRSTAVTDLNKLIAAKRANQDIPDIAKAPVEPQPVTPLAEARAAAGAFRYPRVDAAPFPETGIVPGPDGKKVMSVKFATQQDAPKAILMDMADVVRVSAADTGLAVARYDVQATYGNRVMRVVAPSSAAVSLTKGQITREQFIEHSAVTLDGSPLNPSY
jgi:hypothetical protein